MRAKLAVIVVLVAALYSHPSRLAQARTQSVVIFGARAGIIFLDSLNSIAAFKLFESINAPVVDRMVSQTKIVAPADGRFRISCTGYSADYVCAVIVYSGEYASLDFKTDRVEMTVPGAIAKSYAPFFSATNGHFHFETEDGLLVIDWSRQKMHVLYPAR